MHEEIIALQCTNTFTLVPKPPTTNIIGSKWVYKIKKKTDDSIDIYKAHFVVKGYHQQSRIDFQETYSPVIKTTTICTISVYTTTQG